SYEPIGGPMASELQNFLRTDQAPRIPKPKPGEHRQVAEFSLTEGSVEVPENAPEGAALRFLEDAGQDPDQWEVTGFRRIEYGNPGDPHISTRFTYKRREEAGERVPIDDLLEMIHQHDRPKPLPAGE